VTPEHLASYIGGRAKPPFELIARVAAARNVSLDWLATGTGPRDLEADAPDGYIEVRFEPDIETRFADAESAPILFARTWLEAIGPADAMRLIVHRGNANEPVIRDGEILLVDTSVTAVSGDGLYAFAR
jgi:phage repressor protein C with HTH and peptisase S24 domain